VTASSSWDSAVSSCPRRTDPGLEHRERRLPALGPQRPVDLVVDVEVLAGVGQHAGQRWLVGDHGVNGMRMVRRQVQRDGGAAAVPEDPRRLEPAGPQHGDRIRALPGDGDLDRVIVQRAA
jgi:hypothetical protein